MLFDTPFALVRMSSKKGMFVDEVGEVPCFVNWKAMEVSCSAMADVVC